MLTRNDVPYDATCIYNAGVTKYRGLRQNVISPGGMILEDNGEVKIYYGTSDNVECLATARLQDLINLCADNR